MYKFTWIFHSRDASTLKHLDQIVGAIRYQRVGGSGVEQNDRRRRGLKKDRCRQFHLETNRRDIGDPFFYHVQA